MSDNENPVLNSPLPELEALLRDAAGDARRRAFVPPYESVEGVARGRRTARVAASSLFAVVLGLSIGGAVIAGAGRGDNDRTPDRQPPAASAVALDPSLRQYETKIPVLTWTPDPGRDADSVSRQRQFYTAVFSALGQGDHDYSHIKDLRKVFADAPAAGPAIAIDQSTTRAQLERAATNLLEIDGVRDAKVVVVTGLWFTVSAARPAVTTNGRTEKPPVLDPAGLKMRGTASGSGKDITTGRPTVWVRGTYVGPPITRALFDQMRRRAADAVHIDISQVVVTAESTRPRNSVPIPVRS
jgi:hypothetical protein